MSANVPEKPALEGLEAKWAEQWKADATYRFDRSQPRENVYAIDTPPPTVSGSLTTFLKFVLQIASHDLKLRALDIHSCLVDYLHLVFTRLHAFLLLDSNMF